MNGNCGALLAPPENLNAMLDAAVGLMQCVADQYGDCYPITSPNALNLLNLPNPILIIALRTLIPTFQKGQSVYLSCIPLANALAYIGNTSYSLHWESSFAKGASRDTHGFGTNKIAPGDFEAQVFAFEDYRVFESDRATDQRVLVTTQRLGPNPEPESSPNPISDNSNQTP